MVRQLHFDFWKVVRPRTSTTASLSTFAHLLLIGLAVIGSQEGARAARERFEMIVSYMPPPNPEMRTRGSDGARETIRYVELAPSGLGAGFGAPGMRVDRPPIQSQGPDAGNVGRDSATTPAADAIEGTDSVYTIIDVDTAATRLAESAAPQYPRSLLEKRLEGQAIVQFIVDTNGRADTGSFRVMLASHDEFAQSVRAALPDMRFTTARIGSLKVRQLVELPFNFRVVTPPTDTATTARRPPVSPR